MRQLISRAGALAALLAALLTGLLTAPVPARAAAAAAANTAPGPSAAPQAGSDYEIGLACFERRELSCAFKQAKLARKKQPGLLAARVLLGQAALELGNAQGAETVFDDAIRAGVPRADVAAWLCRAMLAQGKHKLLLVDARCAPAGLAAPARAELLLVRAQAAAELGDTSGAMVALAEAKSAQPASALPWLAEVPLQLRLRQFKPALAAADRALALAAGASASAGPASAAAAAAASTAATIADAEYRRATVLHAQGDREAALAGLARAIAAKPAHIEARLARAGLLLDGARAAQADADLSELQRLAPGDARAAYLRALAAERRGDAAAVQAALREVTAQLDAQPDALMRLQPQLLLLSGVAHFGLGENARAQQALEIYRQSQGDNAAVKLLAQIYLGQGKPEQGAALLEPYLRGRPADPQALALMASANLGLGRNARAVGLMQEALRAQDSAEFHTALGLSLLRAGQREQAIAELQTALKMDPAQTRAAQLLVEVYLQAGQPALAQPLAAALVQREPAQARHRHLLGQVLARQGDVAGARREFEQAVQIAPRLSAAQLDLARLDMAARAWPAARERLDALLKADDKAVDVMLEQARLSELRGQPAEAVNWLETAASKAAPDELRPLLALIELHTRGGRGAAALAAAERALARAPDDYTVLIAISQAELAAGDATAARRRLANAGRLAGSQPAARTLVAQLQLAAGDAAGAAASLDQVLKDQPGLADVQALLADIEIRQGELDRAEQRARRIVALQPKSGLGYALQAQVAQARKKPAVALEMARRAHQLDASSESLLRLYATSVQAEGATKAIPLLERWVQSHPSDLVVRNALGDAQLMTGRLAAARASYEQVLAQAPQANAVRNNLANVLVRLNDPGALALAEQALAAEPQNAELMDTAGWAAFKAGKTERGLQLMRQARQRDAASPAIRYHLAAVLVAAGRKDEARNELNAALQPGRGFQERAEAEALMGTLR